MLNLRSNFNLYYDFYNVAKEKNMTIASKKNFVSLSALSKNIRNLESLLQKKLVITSNRGIELTSDGQKLYDELEIIFNTINSIEKRPNDLVIGTTRNIADNFLAKYIVAFHKLYPDIHISMKMDNPVSLKHMFENHQIDFIIDYLPFNNTNNDVNLVIKPIYSFKTCFACSKEFYKKNQDNLQDIKNVLKQKLLIPGQSRRRQFLNNYLQENNLTVAPIIELPDCKLMIELVKAHVGIGYFIEEELETEELIKLNIDLPLNPFGIIYSNSFVNPISQSFIDLILKNSN